MFEQVEEARAGRGGKVLSEKDISKVNYNGENLNMNDYYFKCLVSLHHLMSSKLLIIAMRKQSVYCKLCSLKLFL